LGVGKRRLILLFIVVLAVVMVRLPTTDAAVDEYLYVHTDDNTNDGDWTEAGTTPWVDAQDEPTNEGYVSASNDLWGNFLIDDTTGTGAINSITLDVYCDSNSEKIEFYIYDLSATQFVLAASDQGSAGYHSNSWDISGIITTVAEINAIEVYAKSKNVGSWGGSTVRLDYVVIHVNIEVAGNDYTAYPAGSFALGGTTALAASFSKTLIEGFALAGVAVLGVAFAVTLIQGFTLVGTTALAGIYSKTLIEGFALVGTTSVFVIIQLLLVDGFALIGGVSLAAAFVVTLVQGFALAGTTALAVVFVVTLIQGFSLGGTVSALKVLIVKLQEGFIVGVGVDITKIVGTVVAASMIHLLFFSLEMWGYLGPIGLVIGGYFVMKKDKNLGVVWFVVECLIMAQYFVLLEATPEYWWHIFILLIGGLSTAAYSLGKR